MAKKDNSYGVFWAAQKEAQVKQEFELYLQEQGEIDSPDSTHCFAISKIQGDYDYLGFREES